MKEQLNSSRESINDRISRYSILGAGKTKAWNKKRRFRTI